ncbi:hypothetical protein [Paenibacillus rhizophilus]|uniref:ZIP family metal transporter n=1 Tax=Paenibacillus rhizophilus TaxID=1850366 RepID=A0A3N9NZ44_9BACL|nr:hypothetical protein [Paenibacillus rhizophilus]RQW09181.1 hypothetical protein EH198_20030 [Paenibacillus rhizophilus]
MGILLGWGLSLTADLPAVVTSSVYAFLSGGMVFNTIKGEFPVKRESSFTAFAAGCAVYTAVWLLAE